MISNIKTSTTVSMISTLRDVILPLAAGKYHPKTAQRIAMMFWEKARRW